VANSHLPAIPGSSQALKTWCGGARKRRVMRIAAGLAALAGSYFRHGYQVAVPPAGAVTHFGARVIHVAGDLFFMSISGLIGIFANSRSGNLKSTAGRLVLMRPRITPMAVRSASFPTYDFLRWYRKTDTANKVPPGNRSSSKR
jgi:hypothetical protein